MGEGRYLYGIIKTNERKSFGPCGIKEVYAIPHQDIACVVSDPPLQDYSSMLKEALGRFLVKHQTIIEKIMKSHTIIPMKFGTNVSDNEEVTEVLRRGYSRFKELLINMDGKIELDVACTWNDLSSIIKEIGDQEKEIREFKREIAKRPPSETLQDRIKVGAMIKTALDKRRDRCQNEMVNFLKEKAVDFQKHEVMDDKMILNCAFLLDKNKEKEFDQSLEELNIRYNEKVNFRCVGPLPPYSFATCQLRKVNFSQIDEARKLLDLSKNSSLEDIKESYRELAKKNHPDKHPENSQIKEEFEKITHAYKLLTSCCQQGGISFPPTPRFRRIGEDKKREDFIVVEITRP